MSEADNVKVHLQLTRLHSSTEKQPCPVQIDEVGGVAVALAAPQAVTFRFDSVHPAVHRVAWDGESSLFNSFEDSVQQLFAGVNSALFLCGHEVYRQNPHDILDGLVSKIFRAISQAAKTSRTHDAQLRAQFVACPPAVDSAVHKHNTSQKFFLDLLSLPESDPPPFSDRPPESAFADGVLHFPDGSYAAYAPLSAADALFTSRTVDVQTAEDAVNCYVMGLHRVSSLFPPTRSVPSALPAGGPDAELRSAAARHLEETRTLSSEVSTVFVLELRLRPLTGDAIPLASKLYIVDLPCYYSEGTGGALTKFLALADDAVAAHEGGRALVSTMPSGVVSPLHEVIIGEGLLGGNCIAAVALFLEVRASVTEATTCRLLDRLSQMRGIGSTPLVNDAQALLHATKVNNTLALLRQMATQSGRGIPLHEFDKHAIRHEVQEERLRGKLLVLTERYRALQAELAGSESERLKATKALAGVVEKSRIQEGASWGTAKDIATRLVKLEQDLAAARSASDELRDCEERLAEAEEERRAVDDDFVALRTEHFAVLAERNVLLARNSELSADLLSALTAQRRPLHAGPDPRQLLVERDDAVAAAKAALAQRDACRAELLAARIGRVSALKAELRTGGAACSELFCRSVDELVAGAAAPEEAPSALLRLRARHSKEVLGMEAEISELKARLGAGGGGASETEGEANSRLARDNEALRRELERLEDRAKRADELQAELAACKQQQQQQQARVPELGRSDAQSGVKGESFEEFLVTTHRAALRDREEYLARAVRAETERDQMEQSTEALLVIHQKEKHQLQNDLAKLRQRLDSKR
ncbi:hypothetical protein DIPPA_04311 [Diplonema papillatum]|nr:hypothetical protein DIPPA_04311 [Diplonema papillatum]